ncbi:MAG: SDR family NAD(P)-dependent oxidoreductase [Janthinobacterium lividum]
MTWNDKVALVTGGGSGIGRAFARHVCAAGGRVLIADVDEAGGHATAEQCGGSGLARFLRTDVTREDDAARAVAEAVAAFGGVDMLHNNASILLRSDRIEDVDPALFSKVVNVNLVGMFLMARAVTAHMRPRRSGVIVNMSSKGGLRGQPHILAYSATKAAALSFTRGLAAQLAPDGIRVNALIPGLVATEMARGGPNMAVAQKAGRYVFEPEEMARAVAYAAEREDLNGAILEYDGTAGRPQMLVLGDFAATEIDPGFGPARPALPSNQTSPA